MKIIVYLLTAISLAAGLPAGGNAREVVQFAFKESELSTSAKRELLLVRIEEETLQSCRSGSPGASARMVHSCASDLRDQFVEAIANPELTLLAETKTTAPLRTARR